MPLIVTMRGNMVTIYNTPAGDADVLWGLNN